jgi:death on curing protein
MTWRWISKAAVLAIHGEQLTEHGGGSGIRDEGLLESALSHPLHLALYNNAEIMELASAYAFGIARNHPFVDGNKRTDFIVAVTFLFLNGYIITASETEVVETFLRLAAGELSEKELSLWFSKHTIQKE